MKICSEKSLKDVEFYSGAVDTVKYLNDDDFDIIEDILNEEYPNGMTDTELNDLFWFDDDTIAQWLGYNDFEDLINKR